MAKITLRVKAILVIVTFLGFTNLILSENRATFSELILTKILPESVSSLLTSEAMPPADAPVKQRAKIRQVSTFESNGIKSSLKSALNPVITIGEITPATCSGNSDGAINISVSNGTGSYTYLWSSGQTSEDISALPPGKYTVTVTDSDNISTTSSEIEITVEDNVKPVAIAKNIIVQLDVNGQATITVADLDNGSSDACGIDSLVLSTESFSCSNVGTNNVTLTATDSNGNTNSDTAIVTVQDNVNPVAIAKNITVQLDVNGQATITAADLDNGSSDACGIDSLVLNKDSFNCSNVGTNSVTLTATDNNGNTNSDTAIVTVQDNVNPVAITKNITVQLDVNGQTTITAADLDNGSSDACGIDSLVLSTDSFNCSNVGTNSVTLTATDSNGNTSSDTVIVTVQDNIIPVIASVSDINTNTDTGLCATIFTITVPSVSDNCSVTSPTGSRSDNKILTDPFPTGETIITWTATDIHNNEAEPVIQKVIVTDNEAPIVPELNDITWGCNYTVAVPVAIDNCDNEITGTANRSTTFNSTGEIIWTFTDGAANVSTVKQIITINPVSVSIQKQDIVCFDAANGIAEAIVSGGVAPFTYNWGTSGNTVSINGLIPGEYTITVTDANGCSANATTTITQPEILKGSVASTNVTCNGNNDGSISISNPSGGFGTFQYSINNGGNWKDSGNFTGIANGIYQVLIRDKSQTGCSIILDSNLEITQPEILAAEVDFTNISCNDQSDGTITVSNYTGGYGTYEFSINNGNSWQNSGNYTGLSDGIYPVLIRDKANINCIVSLNTHLEITRPFILNGDVSGQNISCKGGNDGSITISNSSGGYDLYEYSIDGINWQSDETFNNLTTGNYNVQIRDAVNSGCKIVLDPSFNLTEPQILTATIDSTTDVLCNGYATGSITASAIGGTAPYTYSWGSLGSGATKSNLPAGTYAVTVTDANGCTTEPYPVNITEPDTFVEIISVNTTSGCYQQNNGTARVEAQGGTGNFTYLWSNGQTSQNATGLAPGSHNVQVSDSNGCTTQRTFTISQPAELRITGFLTTETTSYGTATGTATVQVSGGTPSYSFVWSGLGNRTEQTARDLTAGTYTVTVTDVNGCSISGQVTIIDSLDAEIVPTSICEGDEDIVRTSYFQIENLTARGGTPGYTYSWDFGEYATPATATGPGPHKVKYSVIGDKRITLRVTDSKGLTLEKQIIQYVGGCFSNDCGSNDLQAENYFVGDANGNKITSLNCAAAGQKYLYIVFPTNSTRYSLNIEYIYSIENLTSGEILNDREAGCFYQKTSIPEVARTIPINYNCGDVIKIEGIYLTFSNNDNWGCGQGPNPKCYSTNNETSVTIPLYAVAFPNDLLCNGSMNGVINARASGGTGAYTYKLISSTNGSTIRTAQTSSSFTELPAGKYKVVVNDGIESYTTAEVEIKQPLNPLLLELDSQTEITCYMGSDGTATVQASGGTPNSSGDPYIYVWSNGQTTATATNLTAGNYNVRVIDANGCEVASTVTIAQPAELIAVAGPDQVLSCGTTSTALQAEFTSQAPEGQTAQVGEWMIVNGPAGGSFADVNDPQTSFSGAQGTYTLRWSVPCGASDDVKISISYCSTLDFDGINDHINFNDNFNFSGDFTLEAWVKQDASTSSGIKTILSKRNISNLNEGGYDLIVENNIPKFRWNNSLIVSQYPIGTDRWYHIAVIKGGIDEGLYIDGIKTSSSNSSPGLPSSVTNPFIIGAAHNATTPEIPSNYFHGWIEEVRIWNTALNLEQLHFMMNQKLQNNGGKVRGLEIPLDVPGNLTWDKLSGYYQLGIIENGFTLGETTGSPNGKLINITTLQERTAPLPYISTRAGSWFTDATWLRPQVWDPPGSIGVDGSTPIAWNIAKISHNINSGAKNIKVLGLLSKSGKLTIANPGEALNENNSGQSFTITHYLQLNGIIDLIGESQLVQTDILKLEDIQDLQVDLPQSIMSVLEETSSGFIERDQQGTANSYNYNYWSSPVSLQGAANNSNYTIGSVMLDGTNSASPRGLSFGAWHEYADGGYSTPRKISNYWLWKFRGTANVYSEWEFIGSTGTLNTGEGYTMKGTSGQAAIADKQNYVFKGKPNNGTIKLNIQQNQNYLLGNPYPSSIDINKFILDNLNTADVSGGTNNKNVFNGAVYFWDHFAGGDTHILLEYIGGYATRNLIDGVPAISNDYRVNANDASGTKIPGQFVPVAQSFFVNSVIDPEIAGDISVDGGDVLFKNSQRVFMRESSGNSGNSIFLRPEEHTKKAQKEDTRPKIRLDFISPKGYQRQILVGVDSNTTNGIDLGYDAPINDYNLEDMFWLIGAGEFVIQGVPDFNLNRVLPLGMRIAEEGELLIKINQLENISEEVNIYLKDKADSTYHDLRKSNFKLILEKGEINERFEIVFQKEKDPEPDPEPEPTPIEEPNPDLPDTIPPGFIDVIFAENDHELMILNPFEMNIQQVEIYNLLGQRVESFPSNSSQKKMILPVREHPAAMYLVKVYAVEGMVSKSILLIR